MDEQALTEIDLERSLKEAQEFMGPGQLATEITSRIGDDDYLKQVIVQMQNNLNYR